MNIYKPKAAAKIQTQISAPGNRVQGTEKLIFYLEELIFSS